MLAAALLSATALTPAYASHGHGKYRIVHRNGRDCFQTDYWRDGRYMTAAFTAGTYSGGQELDGTGCDIVAYAGAGESLSITADVYAHGGLYFDVVGNGAQSITVKDSTLGKTGDDVFSGNQRGVGVYTTDSPTPTQVDIENNVIMAYQKNGVALLGNVSGRVYRNTVVGHGPTSVIAQNGIELGLGAHEVDVNYNTVVGHSYTGPNFASSGGILALGGDCWQGPTQTYNNISNNYGNGNDVGVYEYNLDSTCTTAVSIPTHNVVRKNQLNNDAVNNTTGDGTGPYQVGIAVGDNGPRVVKNQICGIGYNDTDQHGGLIAPIDSSGSINAKIKGTGCKNPGAQEIIATGRIIDVKALARRMQPFDMTMKPNS